MRETDGDNQPPQMSPEYRHLLTTSSWFAVPGHALRKGDSILEDGLPDIDEDHTVGHTHELTRFDDRRKYTLAVDAHDEIAGMDDGFTRNKNGAVRLAFIRFNSKCHTNDEEDEKANGWVSIWSDGTAQGYADLNPGSEEIDVDFLRSLGMGGHTLPEPDDVYAHTEHNYDTNDMGKLTGALQTFYFEQ